ncbi:MAG: hypothetical protein A2161_17455 [Candidatus Schekmanbacteria bacterium RBG_13_48_7]|uniref:Uncharacterized protein n=1 Tax=Candidatus Schekmanbacteria bacterium RBG_13_48_7 TaxID=1817878 RepID=A0A1F7S3C0_9BACT|nr:MAG: hypothetical protein A2161_17455 [Candidatus Schekmanbacteria bacterium RBG_13_48_7]
MNNFHGLLRCNRFEWDVLPKLKPSVKTISLRLPGSIIVELKILANKRDVPYQSLLKIFLAERIEKELKLHTACAPEV